jgi:hypothetical protein
MTLGDAFIGALELAGYNILQADRDKILAFFHNLDENLASKLVQLIIDNFPRQSVEERMLSGPLDSLLKNALPGMVADLDAGVYTALDTINNILKSGAKSAGETP